MPRRRKAPARRPAPGPSANDAASHQPRAMRLSPALDANDALLRELHHRFRNNFQVIASLLSLQARGLPRNRRGELRFVEEQVQAMAAAYRGVSVVHGVVEVGLAGLVGDVVASLRHLAGIGHEAVALSLPVGRRMLRIDQAIALGLYLAVLLPPYLDDSAVADDALRIEVDLPDEDWIRLALIPPRAAGTVRPGLLRRRLGRIYLSQLAAMAEPPEPRGGVRLRIHAPPIRPAAPD